VSVATHIHACSQLAVLQALAQHTENGEVVDAFTRTHLLTHMHIDIKMYAVQCAYKAKKKNIATVATMDLLIFITSTEPRNNDSPIETVKRALVSLKRWIASARPPQKLNTHYTSASSSTLEGKRTQGRRITK